MSPSTSTDIGAVDTTGSPVARSVCSFTARPRVVTMGPSLRKAEAISCASETRPPPLSRRSSTKTLAPRFCSLRSAASTSACAPELNCDRRTTPTGQPPERAQLRGDDRHGDRRARHGLRIALAVPDPREAHLAAGRTLDPVDGFLLRQACEVVPVGGHDDVALAQSGPLGRRPVVDGVDAQTLRVGRDLKPDARELGVLRVLEPLVLRRIEVVGEAVVELGHDAGDGVVGQRRLAGSAGSRCRAPGRSPRGRPRCRRLPRARRAPARGATTSGARPPRYRAAARRPRGRARERSVGRRRAGARHHRVRGRTSAARQATSLRRAG